MIVAGTLGGLPHIDVYLTIVSLTPMSNAVATQRLPQARESNHSALSLPFYQKPTPGILIKPGKNETREWHSKLQSKKVTIALSEGDDETDETDETETSTIITFEEEEDEYVRVQRDR